MIGSCRLPGHARLVLEEGMLGRSNQPQLDLAEDYRSTVHRQISEPT